MMEFGFVLTPTEVRFFIGVLISPHFHLLLIQVLQLFM